MRSQHFWVTLFPVEVNGPLWSIGFEVTSYLLLPIGFVALFALAPRIGNGWRTRGLWLGVIAAALIAHTLFVRFVHPGSLQRGWDYGLIGGAMQSPVDASYLADTVVLMRYYELEGEVRQAISVVKKRGSMHERTIRPLTLGAHGIHIGEPLRHYRGILTGVPVPTGPAGTTP